MTGGAHPAHLWLREKQSCLRRARARSPCWNAVLGRADVLRMLLNFGGHRTWDWTGRPSQRNLQRAETSCALAASGSQIPCYSRYRRRHCRCRRLTRDRRVTSGARHRQCAAMAKEFVETVRALGQGRSTRNHQLDYSCQAHGSVGAGEGGSPGVCCRPNTFFEQGHRRSVPGRMGDDLRFGHRSHRSRGVSLHPRRGRNSDDCSRTRSSATRCGSATIGWRRAGDRGRTCCR